MFDPKKKKPVMGVMIAVGKQKPDLSEPDSLEEKPKAKPAVEAEEAEERYKPGADYGAKLVADLEAAGEEHGLDAEQSRAVAASMFSAMAKCLAGEKEPEHDAGGMDLEGEEE